MFPRLPIPPLKLTKLWECNQLASLLASFGDEIDRLLDRLFQVEPAWLGLNTSSLVLTNSGNHVGVGSLVLLEEYLPYQIDD
jgi:hypothetical protein